MIDTRTESTLLHYKKTVFVTATLLQVLALD